MKYLLDTNVISEAMKVNADPFVAKWVTRVREQDMALSVIALMELRQGTELMPIGKRRQTLEAWLEQEVPRRFANRILGIDSETADVCGRMLAQNRLRTDIRRIMDIWLAAIALQHNLTVVTRNTRDFEHLGSALFNPWTEEAAP